MDTAASNIPEYTVTEISGAVKRTLEGAFSRVRVRGEITDFKRYPSGHMYFSLKDAGGKISGVVWKTTVGKLGLVPENGVEVIATGRVSAYGDRSSYQLVVERMDYAGAGALLARIEMLRVRLAEEGLFDAARKRPIPLLPAIVGVVTSSSGAVLHDICTTIARRFPRPILVWPVPVQGEGAARKIAAAIAGFDRIEAGGPIPRPDVLIVARGGGSLEDLMAFNDEAVIRAVALCRIPLISAVGHETDHTLIDLASDRRAPTPTAAAELAVPSRTELVATLAQETARLAGALHRMTQERRLRLGVAAHALPDLPALLGTARQRTDDRGQRLALALPNLLVARRVALSRAERQIPDLPALLRTARQSIRTHTDRLLLALPNLVARRRSALAEARLPAPNTLVIPAQTHLRFAAAALIQAVKPTTARHRDALAKRHLPASLTLIAPARAAIRLSTAALAHALQRATARHRDAEARIAARLSPAPLLSSLREARTRLDASAARLDSVSHQAVLARGYALVFDRAGHPLTRSAAIKPGATLTLRFADGEKQATATTPTSQTSLPL